MKGRNKLKNSLDGDVLPLEFAKYICAETGLWDDDPKSGFEVRYEQNDKLKNFQKMAISCNFRDSLIAYHGDDLSEVHMKGLEVIHKATKPWLKGDVVGVLLEKMNDGRMQNKDFAAAIEIIMNQLLGTEELNKRDGDKTKSLIVHFSDK